MTEPIFKDLTAENPQEASEIDSLCLNCKEDGKTRLLFTKIPFFKEVVLMSFECNSCGWKNNELQPAAVIGEKGIQYKVNVNTINDLSRQVVKTEWAEICIPEVEFEVTKQSGLITTIEGLIERAIEGLTPAAEETKEPKLIQFIEKMKELKEGKKPFTFLLKDPTGNSFIENPLAPEQDPKMEVIHYTRTSDEDKSIGILPAEESTISETQALLSVDPEELIKGEVHELPTNCPACNAPCNTRMKVTEIPHFKQVVIMATNCDACGARTNEVKSGCGIEDQGVKIQLHINNAEQLSYDLVKSDTCAIRIPELHLELEPNGQGRYTTAEGLFKGIRDQLSSANPFACGDSGENEKMKNILEKLDNPIGLTLILDDPAGNSWMDKPDFSGKYTRTWQQNEELGLNDMKVEGYEEQ